MTRSLTGDWTRDLPLSKQALGYRGGGYMYYINLNPWQPDIETNKNVILTARCVITGHFAINTTITSTATVISNKVFTKDVCDTSIRTGCEIKYNEFKRNNLRRWCHNKAISGSSKQIPIVTITSTKNLHPSV